MNQERIDTLKEKVKDVGGYAEHVADLDPDLMGETQEETEANRRAIRAEVRENVRIILAALDILGNKDRVKREEALLAKTILHTRKTLENPSLSDVKDSYTYLEDLLVDNIDEGDPDLEVAFQELARLGRFIANLTKALGSEGCPLAVALGLQGRERPLFDPQDPPLTRDEPKIPWREPEEEEES